MQAEQFTRPEQLHDARNWVKLCLNLRMRRAADLGRYGRYCRPPRRVLGFMLRHHSNGAGRTSGENLFVVLLDIDPTSHELGSPANPGACVDAPGLARRFFDGCLRTRNSIGRVSGLIMWPEAATGRDAVRRTGSTSVQRAWLARAPGLAYPILNIEVLSASFRQSIFSPGLITPGIYRIAAQRRQRIMPSCNSAPLSSSPI